MTVFMEPKLDWKASDFFNFQDINRISSNLVAVVDKIQVKHGKTIVLENMDVSRDLTSIYTIDDINKIERNLEKIRKNWIDGLHMRRGGKQWTIETPFTYEDAVIWEHNLYYLYRFASLEFTSYFGKYCGLSYTENRIGVL